LKKDVTKKVVFGVTAIIMFLGIAMKTVTMLQALPFLVYFILAGLSFGKIKVGIWLSILAGVMFLTNLVVFSITDLIIWGAIFVLYIKD